jgi:methionyl-tRNA formyltransferase
VRVVDAEGAEVARMRLVRAVAAGEDGPRWEAGEITSAGTVQCADGCMEVLECQPDGGRPMSMADYRRGHRWQAGLRLQGVE